MSEFKVEVIRLGTIFEHEQSTDLDYTILDDGRVAVFGRFEYTEGELVVCIPAGAVVPDEPQYEFLNGRRRIKAKKIRGIVSECLLMDLPEEFRSEYPENILGLDLADWLHIEEYKPPFKGPATPPRTRRRRHRSVFKRLKRAIRNIFEWTGITSLKRTPQLPHVKFNHASSGRTSCAHPNYPANFDQKTGEPLRDPNTTEYGLGR